MGNGRELSQFELQCLAISSRYPLDVPTNTRADPTSKSCATSGVKAPQKVVELQVILAQQLLLASTVPVLVGTEATHIGLSADFAMAIC